MAGQMDYGRFIETKSYNIPVDAPIGTWATYTSNPPITGDPNTTWNATDKGYYNLVGDTDASFNEVRSYSGAATGYQIDLYDPKTLYIIAT